MDPRKTYATDVSDEEWALISSYLELLPDASRQRHHASRDVFNALRYVVRSGIQWRMLPLVERVQDETGGTVEVAYADQGYTGENAAKATEAEGVELVVVKRNPAQHTFIVLHKRWIVECSFGWIARCRRLLWDFERLNEMLVGVHMVAFVCVMSRQVSQLIWRTS